MITFKDKLNCIHSFIHSGNVAKRKQVAIFRTKKNYFEYFFHQHQCAQLYQKTQLDFKLNYYAFDQRRSSVCKSTDAKADLRVLMKLTPGVNFINILSANFSYKSTLHSFSLITVWPCNYLSK